MMQNAFARSLLSTRRVVKLVLFATLLTTVSLCNKVAASTSVAGEKEESVGFALNGGGFIAAAGTAAILRGFQQQTIEVDGEQKPSLDAIDMITCSSGGCLTNTIYHYAQTSSSAEIFDADYRIYHPSQVTPKALRRKNRKAIFYYLTKSVSLKMLPIYLGESSLLRNSQSVWPLVMWWAILKPFGIKRNKFFGPKSHKSKKNTVVPRDEVKSTPLIVFQISGYAEDSGASIEGTAFPKLLDDIKSTNSYRTKSIMNSLEIEKVFAKNGNQIPIDCIASPEEVRTGFTLDMTTDKGLLTPAEKIEKPWEFGDSEKDRFSLETAMGAATNMLGMLKPEASIQREVKFGNTKKNMVLGDRGANGDPAIAPLVQKGMRHIIAPYWYTDSESQYSLVYNRTKNKNITEWLFDDDNWGKGGYRAGLVSYFGYGVQGAWNHMFDDGELHMQTLREAFDDLYLADKPLIFTIKDIKVIDNPYHGIEGGGLVDITFWHVHMPKKFSRHVPRESVPPPKGVNETVDEFGSFTNKEFMHFPNIRTYGEVPNRLWEDGQLYKVRTARNFGTLTMRQANMMSYLGSWLVNEAWEGTYIDGKQYFGGFKEILEK